MTPVYKLSANSVKNGRTVYGSMLAGNTAFKPTSFESIATVSLSSSAASVTFSSIPATYTHLQVRAIILGTGAISYQPMTFNSDTGSNYTNHGITATGAGTPSAFGEANHGFISHQDAVATNPFAMVMDILDYANTNKYKTVRTLGGYDANGSGTLTFRSGLWRNTNAITTIKIEPNTNNYAQYSHFALYGIKAA